MHTRHWQLAALVLAGLLLGTAASRTAAAEAEPAFSHGLIASIDVASEGHVTAVKNGVRFDVYFDKGVKANAAIYAINTSRRQLVLTPAQHEAILEDLIRRKFIVIVADFRDKKLTGLDLEKYVVQLTADAREIAEKSAADIHAEDYFTLMPGFTVERDVTWFRYSDIPAAYRQEIAKQLGKPFSNADASKANTYDIIHPVYGPAVAVLTNYASNEKGREPYLPLDNRYLVQAFALKNMAIVHQQYFNEPVGGYPKAYEYYGDQFAISFIRHLKGNAAKYHINADKICCFGHSKGSELPGMLVNKLRATPKYQHSKADFKKITLGEMDKTIPSPFGDLSAEIACAILGAGVANNELRSDKVLPWDHEPARNISPFLIYADHRGLTRERTRELVAKARAHGVAVETTELSSHTWPIADAYDQASAFADRILQLDY